MKLLEGEFVEESQLVALHHFLVSRVGKSQFKVFRDLVAPHVRPGHRTGRPIKYDSMYHQAVLQHFPVMLRAWSESRINDQWNEVDLPEGVRKAAALPPPNRSNRAQWLKVLRLMMEESYGGSFLTPWGHVRGNLVNLHELIEPNDWRDAVQAKEAAMRLKTGRRLVAADQRECVIGAARELELDKGDNIRNSFYMLLENWRSFPELAQYANHLITSQCDTTQ